MVVDGTGNPWFKADIAIANGKIFKIGNLVAETADIKIDAEKHIVCPGFFDMHSHSDFTLLVNSLAESKIRQGVTTEVIGNCGSSAAPLNDLLKEDIQGTMPLLEEADLELTWETLGQYKKILQSKGVALNVAPLVGNSNIRVAVLGFENRQATLDELEEMKKVLAQAMRDGAFGMSTGLIYPPSCYADIDEIVELAKISCSFGGIYASHIRGEGSTLIDAVREAIEIGRRARIPVEISHHKASEQANWGKVKGTLQMLEKAREQGIDITCDVYPYVAGSTGLDALLPPTSYEGGVERLIERLKDQESRKKIKEVMTGENRDNQYKAWGTPDWSKIKISYCREHPEFEGQSIEEIARRRKLDPFEFVFDLLIETKASARIILFIIREEDMQYVLKHRLSMIGSDSSALATYGILAKGNPHPRAYGTFPRILGKYVRKKKILTFERAIQKMTSFPAQKLKLMNRGLIREEMQADIVILDKKKVIDEATYLDPHKYPKGIEYVLVNGKIVIKHGKHTKTLPGEVLTPIRQEKTQKHVLD
ncbi:MAG: D-aminoacylase [Candidatus Bathyarchaeota archaeon]